MLERAKGMRLPPRMATRRIRLFMVICLLNWDFGNSRHGFSGECGSGGRERRIGGRRRRIGWLRKCHGPLVLSSRTSSLSSRTRSGIQCHTTTGLRVRPAMTKPGERSGRWGAQRRSFWGQSPNSPSRRLAHRVRRIASQRNWRLTPITRGTAAELSAPSARSTQDAKRAWAWACHHFKNDPK